MTTYKYEPMYDKVNRFRLFKETILSYHGTWETLHCELVERDIDHAPPYYALSYEWGTDSPASIYTDDQTLSIPKPLHEFIGRLASSPSIEYSYFYADAICINQDDKSEKDAQIPALGRHIS